MLALIFSDLHASYKQLANLKSYLSDHKDIDVLISAGDFVNMGEPAAIIDKVVEIIQSVNLPLMWVPGNNDFGRSYHRLNAKIRSLEGRIVKYHQPVIPAKAGILGGEIPDQVRDDNIISFTGVGGSPASWEGQYAGETTTDKIKIAGTVFVSHTPPPGLLVMNKYDCDFPANPVISTPFDELRVNSVEKSFPDKISRQARDDKTAGRRFSDAPLVHICGHQHTRWGCGYLGTTKVINPGPLAEGRYAILDLDTLSVKLEKFAEVVNHDFS